MAAETRGGVQEEGKTTGKAEAGLDTPTMPDDESLVAEGSKLVAAFHTAAKAGDTATLSKLLNSSTSGLPSALLLNARERKGGRTALHVACRAGVPTTLAWLLDKGASVLVTDTEGYTPLDHARAKPRNTGCLECVHLLQEHIREQPPSIKEIGVLVASFFEAPLDRAWMDWALDYYGPYLLDRKGRDNRSPLHFAVTHNDAALLEELLEMGADPFVKDREGLSPLDMVMMGGHKASIQTLSRAMRTQLVSFLGLAVLFLLYRRGGNAQQAWVVLATLWPLGKTWHVLLLGREKPPAAASAAVRGRAQGEWLTYWALLVPVVLLEYAVTTHLLPSPVFQQLLAPRSQGGHENVNLLRTLTDLYMIAKIVTTLYLIYPASRGARRVFRWLEGGREGGREERMKKAKGRDDGKMKKKDD